MVYVINDLPFCFRPEQGVQQREDEENYGNLGKDHVWNVCSSLKLHIMGMLSVVFLQDDISVSEDPIVGFVQLNSDKTTMTLNANAPIEYTFPAAPLKFSPHWCSRVMNNGHTMAEMVPVVNAECWEHFVRDVVTLIHVFTTSSAVEVQSLLLLTTDAAGSYWK